jgi:hypothetical protein
MQRWSKTSICEGLMRAIVAGLREREDARAADVG